MRAMWDLDFTSGALVCVPVPAADGPAARRMERAISQALSDAAAAGIKGKAVTPYLLSRITDLTHGESLAANLALLENNAKVAAQVAVAIGSNHRCN